MSDAVYIIDGARTPMGGLMGELSTLSAVNLGEVAIRSALEKSNLSGDDIDEVIMGCVLPSGTPSRTCQTSCNRRRYPRQRRRHYDQ